MKKEVTSYKNKNGESLWMYRHRYKDINGEWREKKKMGFKTEKAAQRSLLEVKAALLEGAYMRVESDQITVGEWLDRWYEANKSIWKESTRIQREMAIRLQYKPLLGHYKLTQLDKSTYKRVFINSITKRYKIGTALLFHRIFKVAMNAAVEEEIIPRNRFTGIKLQGEDDAAYEKLHIDENTMNYYDQEQLDLLLQTAKETVQVTPYMLLLTIAYSGMRKGEAYGLQWKHLDFEKNLIAIMQTRDNKGTRSPKTKNSYRTIMMSKSVMDELLQYRKWCKETMLSYGLQWSPESFVFISYQNGEPYADNSLLYALRKVQKVSGLHRVTPHGLRHTHATLLMLNPKINVKTIADRLGNTVDMIHTIYGHVLQQMEVESMLAFDEIMDKAKQQRSGIRLLK